MGLVFGFWCRASGGSLGVREAVRHCVFGVGELAHGKEVFAGGGDLLGGLGPALSKGLWQRVALYGKFCWFDRWIWHYKEDSKFDGSG